MFETAPPPGSEALRGHDVPRPFVIAPPPAEPREDPAGSQVVFDLTLVGRGTTFELGRYRLEDGEEGPG